MLHATVSVRYDEDHGIKSSGKAVDVSWSRNPWKRVRLVEVKYLKQLASVIPW
jgi:hypothetical protein